MITMTIIIIIKIIVLFFGYLILLFCWFYLFILEKNVNQCMYNLKGKVTGKFKKFNLAF